MFLFPETVVLKSVLDVLQGRVVVGIMTGIGAGYPRNRGSILVVALNFSVPQRADCTVSKLSPLSAEH
jgi:hypothetical protein